MIGYLNQLTVIITLKKTSNHGKPDRIFLQNLKYICVHNVLVENVTCYVTVVSKERGTVVQPFPKSRVFGPPYKNKNGAVPPK